MKALQNICLSLTVVATVLGCSTDSDFDNQTSTLYVSSLATKAGGEVDYFGDLSEEDDLSTRGLFIGGQTGNRFVMLWDTKDVAQVYVNNNYLGNISPKSGSTGTISAALTGTLNSSVPIAVGDELKLYLPSPELDYRGQNGSMADMCTNFDFRTATAKVASVDGNSITTEEITFNSLQTYFMFKFKDENDQLLHVKQLVVNSESGKIVETKSADGTTTYTNELVIICGKDHSSVDDYAQEVYFVILNESGKKDSYTFTVTASDGKIYKGSSALSYQAKAGKFASARRSTYCATVDVDAQTAITPPESEDPDVQQVTL